MTQEARKEERWGAWWGDRERPSERGEIGLAWGWGVRNMLGWEGET